MEQSQSPITQAFTERSLSTFCKQWEKPTESFQDVVMAGLLELVKQKRAEACVVIVKNDRCAAVISSEELNNPDELCAQDDAFAEKGWPAVRVHSLPVSTSHEELIAFANKVVDE